MQQPAQVTASRTPAPVQAARVLLTAVAISHLAVPLAPRPSPDGLEFLDRVNGHWRRSMVAFTDRNPWPDAR